MTDHSDYDDLVARLRAADPVADWSPDADAALQRLATVEPDVERATRTTAASGTIEVRIGDLAVVHQPEPPRRPTRRNLYVAVVGAAAALALLVGLVVPRLLQSNGDAKERLSVASLRPSPSATSAAARPTTPVLAHPPVTRPTPALTTLGTRVSASPGTGGIVAPPPAGLAVTVSLSATTVQSGGHIAVRYSWTDGNGPFLYVNPIGITALKVVRPPRCTGAVPAPKPSKGSGSWTFSVPLQAPYLIDGLRLPFDHPERIRVGVEVATGSSCVPVESKVVTQWVTIYPPPAPAATPTS